MNLTFNGTDEEYAQKCLYDLLVTKKLDTKKGIAVAVNDTIVPKTKWKAQVLKENDKVVVITATAGG